jgi:hypothetical protein
MKNTRDPTRIETPVTPAITGETHFLNGEARAILPEVPICFQDKRPWTIELWFSADALTDNMTLVAKADEFSLSIDNGRLFAALMGQTTPLKGMLALSIDEFYHVAVIYDGMNMSMLLNGALLAQATTEASPAATGHPIAIGGGFYGQIQGFRAWSMAISSQALSDNQWNDFPPKTLGLLAQLDFTVSPPMDSSGRSVVPKFTGGMKFLSLVPAVVLDANAFCEPYNDYGVNPAGSNLPFSITAWVCPSYIGETMYIFSNGLDETASGMILYVDAHGHLVFQVGAASSPSLISLASLQADAWYYLAVTWANGMGSLYVNGVLDKKEAGMRLDGSMQYGEPLIGAVASEGAELPISCFRGLIQSVAIWKVALTAELVLQYMDVTSNNPQTSDYCVADYELGIEPAQNTITFNPVGLVAGARVDSIPVQPPFGFAASPRCATAVPLQEAGAPGSPPQEEWAKKLGSPEFIDQALKEYEEFLSTLALTDRQREAFLAQFRDKIRGGQGEFLAGRMGGRCRIDRLGNGINRLMYIDHEGEHMVYEGNLSPCVLWCITLIAEILGALLTAFGFAITWTKYLNGFTTFLGTRINNIGIMPQLVALLNAGISANTIYKTMKLLHEFSLLIPLARLSWGLLTKAVSWWTIISVGARILLCFTPIAALEIAWLVAQLAYSVYRIITVWHERPQGCP